MYLYIYIYVYVALIIPVIHIIPIILILFLFLTGASMSYPLDHAKALSMALQKVTKKFNNYIFTRRCNPINLKKEVSVPMHCLA